MRANTVVKYGNRFIWSLFRGMPSRMTGVDQSSPASTSWKATRNASSLAIAPALIASGSIRRAMSPVDTSGQCLASSNPAARVDLPAPGMPVMATTMRVSTGSPTRIDDGLFGFHGRPHHATPWAHRVARRAVCQSMVTPSRTTGPVPTPRIGTSYRSANSLTNRMMTPGALHAVHPPDGRVEGRPRRSTRCRTGGWGRRPCRPPASTTPRCAESSW